MARLGCRCGYTMSNTSCPSPCMLDVFYEKELRDAVAFNPDLRWLDLQMEWDELHECQKQYMQRSEVVEYWFCPECKRVYEVSVENGKWIRLYRRSENVPEVSVDGWKAIYVFPDMEVDPYTEEDSDVTVEELAFHRFAHKYSYRISPDETLVVAFDKSDGSPAFCYELEVKKISTADCK